mgnify:CR=1 FL=1
MDIIGKRKTWFTISCVILAIGFLAMIVRGGLNLGIDFTGGILMQIEFEEDVSVLKVQEILKSEELMDIDIGKSVVQRSDNIMLIRTRELSEDQVDKVVSVLKAEAGDLVNRGVKRIGPVVGKETFRSAALGLLIASFLILVYIYIRFEFQFALAAVLALLHDVFVILGLFALCQFEINSPIIAAVLTIVGYSINDTIVVYDRIRENLRLYKKDSIEDVVNKSISQSLRRSINTSVTTLLVVVALLVLGAPVIREFSLALFFGIIAGTYSSIFIASPLWVTWKLRKAN